MDKAMKNSNKLREALSQNPNLPVRIFCGDTCNNGDFRYQEAANVFVTVDDLTLYKTKSGEEIWLDTDDLTDVIQEEMENDPEYDFLEGEDFFRVLEEKMCAEKFEKTICIYVE